MLCQTKRALEALHGLERAGADAGLVSELRGLLASLDGFAVDASVAADAARFDAEKMFEDGRAAGYREGFKDAVEVMRRLRA